MQIHPGFAEIVLKNGAVISGSIDGLTIDGYIRMLVNAGTRYVAPSDVDQIIQN